MICLTGVVTALLAIASTLATHQNQAVQQWPYRFSINSLVSAYAVVLKGAMLVVISSGISQLKWRWFDTSRPLSDMNDWDQASRGVWGSAVLIWRLKARHLAATVGAIITILAIAVDPMIQFLVRYDNCNIDQQSFTAHMARSGKFRTVGYHIGAGMNQLPTDLVNIITAGLFKPEAVALPVTCSTGNCTFGEPYHSLGYCGNCEDVSSQLILSCENHTITKPVKLSNGTTVNEAYPGERCNYTLPNGVHNVLDSQVYQQSYFLVQGDTQGSSNYSIIANNLTYLNNTTALVGDTTNEFRFEDCFMPSSDPSWICAGGEAAMCTLDPCIRTYNATIVNNKLQEDTIAISRVFHPTVDEDGGSWSAVDVPCLPLDVRQLLIDQEYPITDSTQWIGYDGPTYYNWSRYGDEPPPVVIPDTCLYQIAVINDLSLNWYLYTLLSGNVTGGINYLYEMVGQPGPVELLNGGNVSFESINTSFSGLSDAIANYIRQGQAGTAGNYPANGTVWREEICIGVRWPFLILPAALVVLTLVFFVVMLVKTETYLTSYDWKDSAIALILHGIQYQSLKSQRLVTKLDTKPRMDSVAKELEVRMAHDSDEDESFFEAVGQMGLGEDSPSVVKSPGLPETQTFMIKRKPVTRTLAVTISP